MEQLINYFESKVTKRMKYSFLIAFLTGLLIHLYIITNGFVNHDTMYNYYSNQNMSSSGRFTLTYLAGISSYFDLHLLNGLLSILYLALTVSLMVELLNIKSKLAILLTAILYISFPTIAGIFMYMFTADGYNLGTLLAVMSIYCVMKVHKSYVAVIIASLLLYVSIASYQANLAIVLTLVLIIFVKDNFEQNVSLSFYVKNIISIILGLGLYVFHFKLYDRYSENGLTSYKGINESGNINLDHIIQSLEMARDEMTSFLFNSGEYINTFEKFNIVYFVLLFIMLLLSIFVCKLHWKNIIGLIISTVLAPYITHILFFISPGVEYHILMRQNLVLLFIVGVVIIDLLYKHKSVHTIGFTILFTFSVSLVAFNNVIITNIYYEKFEDVNKQTSSLLTQVAYDIRHLDGYNENLNIIIFGTPSIHLSVGNRYEKVPPNVGTTTRVIYDTNTFVYYLNNEIGLKNGIKFEMQNFIDKHIEEINTLTIWPDQSSMKIIEDTVVIKFE
ncbi:glucosyltransferase domain-containing protein [Ureibacillus manganicus]|uniref:Glycosyltransferase RgtA/B/C/D-like domain-containing protein n=1 Tax=Ureibacillus manganicus DSM 26584 TaxID=1384049 RepID=A0A0A3I744_9BACL|nr:glucosyltransferase domain-containing protein [Ureibacillus manganicus]KGR78543.1 hypothetical protein CD29_10885 [Ureibacillus manganicus DSM 26584]